MPPGAPWWAYLIPVGVDLVKGLIGSGKEKVQACTTEACRRAKAKKAKAAEQRRRMTETNEVTEGD
jgi:hypothetical protein